MNSIDQVRITSVALNIEFRAYVMTTNTMYG